MSNTLSFRRQLGVAPHPLHSSRGRCIPAMEPPRTVSYCDLGLGSQGGIVEKVDRRPESVQGAGPEADEKGHADEGEPGLMDGMDHEAHGSHEGGGGDQEAGQQLAETALVEAAAASQHHHAQPRTESREFTPVQLQQLESMYEHTQDPDWFTGRVISRRIGVTEAEVQDWFKNKRAKDWRNETYRC